MRLRSLAGRFRTSVFSPLDAVVAPGRLAIFRSGDAAGGVVTPPHHGFRVSLLIQSRFANDIKTSLRGLKLQCDSHKL